MSIKTYVMATLLVGGCFANAAGTATPAKANATTAAPNGSNCSALPNGTVKCWGDNGGSGTLGSGSGSPSPSAGGPIRANTGSPGNGAPVGDNGTGGANGSKCESLPNGTVKCWGNNGDNGTGGTTGSNSGGMPNVPTVDPKVCKAEAPKVKKQGENCLTIGSETARRACFDKIGNSMPNGFFESCRTDLEPVKQEIMAKEKAKYPNQASGIDSNSSSGSQGESSPSRGAKETKAASNVACEKLVSTVRGQALLCLPMASQPMRKKCFDKVGESIDKSGNQDACRDNLDQLKSEVVSQEKQKYPRQESALQ